MPNLDDADYRDAVVTAIDAFLQGDGSDVSQTVTGLFFIKHGPRRDQLLSLLKDSAEIARFDNSVFRCGYQYSSVSLDSLMNWLLKTAMEQPNNGADAVALLHRFLSSDCTPTLQIVLMQGIGLVKPVQLSNTLHLVPAHEVPSSEFRRELDQRRNRLNYDDGFVKAPWESFLTQNTWPSAALVRHIASQGTLFPQGPPEDMGKHIPPFVDPSPDEIEDVVALITLFASSSPVRLCEWMELEDGVPLKGYLGGFLGQHLYEALNRQMMLLTEDDLNTLPELLDKFGKLPPKLRRMLRLSLTRLASSRRRHTLTDRAIDLGIAFEPLLLGEQKSDDGIAFPFRLRGAYLLGAAEVERRKHYMKLLNDLYTLRSRAVHGSELLTDKEKRAGKFLPLAILEEGTAACVEAIRKLIDLGDVPDWNELILGVPNAAPDMKQA